MSYSQQMIPFLHRFFEIKLYIAPDLVGCGNENIRFHNYNFNPVFLRISSSQDGKVYEIPSLICNPGILTRIVTGVVGESVTPLSVTTFQTRRTADSIFKYFFKSRYSYSNYLELREVVTNKGEVYYGAPGLILNNSFEPIVIGLSEYKKEGSDIIFDRYVLKVNPEVFTSQGLLEKAIVKKLIPFYTRNDVGGKTVRVEVDDISKYVVRPTPPKAKVQEIMKDIIHTYKDEILADII